MKSYKESSFQDRIERAAEAKKAALDRLRSKAPVDPEAAAERAAKRLAREAAEAEKREAKRTAEREAKAAKAAAATAAPAAVPTDEDRKAARDARYAARKKRK